MKIVLPGGSGQVGTLLARAFHGDGHDVVVLARQPRLRDAGTKGDRGRTPWRVVGWDTSVRGSWAEELEGSDVVINLAGRSVNCRYTPDNRREILESRVHSTRAVGDAIARAGRPPRVWLQASTATIYAHRYDGSNDEATGIIGGDEPDAPAAWRFSIEVARAWEEACQRAQVGDTRKVLLRSAIVLSPDAGGIFDTLMGLTRRGLGGAAGDGRQFVSWIHGEDFVRAIRVLIDRDDLAGVVNVAAPAPVTNTEFMRALRAAAGVRVGLPSPRWLLAIGAMAMRTETELLLKSRRVVPGRLLAKGFVFRYPEWPSSARDLCRAWRDARRQVREIGRGGPSGPPAA